jgi:hypothetical protein
MGVAFRELPGGRSRRRLPQSRDRELQGSTHCGYCVHGTHLLPMDHDRQDVSTPATRCAAGVMPVAVSLSNAPPTATPSSVMGLTTEIRIRGQGSRAAMLPVAPEHRSASTTLGLRTTVQDPACVRGNALTRIASVSAVSREEFLYDFKRRLRAAAARPSSPPTTGTRRARHPPPAAARPRRAHPPQHGRRRKGEGCEWLGWPGSGAATSRVRAPRLGTLHPDADRPILAGWSGCTRPGCCRGPERSSPSFGPGSPGRRNFFPSSPDSACSACAASTCRPRYGDALSGYRPASQGAREPVWSV